MQTLKSYFLLLLNISTIVFLAYVSQSGFLTSFVLAAFITFCMIAIPFLAAHAAKQYLTLSIKPGYGRG
jgi:uncharacterized membrane protein